MEFPGRAGQGNPLMTQPANPGVHSRPEHLIHCHRDGFAIFAFFKKGVF